MAQASADQEGDKYRKDVRKSWRRLVWWSRVKEHEEVPREDVTKLCVFGSIEAIRTKENKGLRQVQWRKSLGGTPLRDPSLTRLGSGDMQVSLAQALTRMRSDVASPSSSYSADSPTP